MRTARGQALREPQQAENTLCGTRNFLRQRHALPRGEEHVAADPVQLPAGYRGRAGDPAHDGARGRLLRRTLPHPAAGYQFVHQQPHARTDHRIGGLARDGRLAPAVPSLRNSRHRAAADAAAAAHPATRKSGRPNSAFCSHTVPDRNVAAIRNGTPSGNHIPTGNAAACPRHDRRRSGAFPQAALRRGYRRTETQRGDGRLLLRHLHGARGGFQPAFPDAALRHEQLGQRHDDLDLLPRDHAPGLLHHANPRPASAATRSSSRSA